jgi:hypothetical protein
MRARYDAAMRPALGAGKETRYAASLVRKQARVLPVLVAVAVLAATVVARFATTNAHADVVAVLQGNVGPDFSISLKNPDGSVVGHLDPGDYEIQVNDQATNHNFHLEGPGVSMATDIDGLGPADWTVSLGDGVFTYHCDRHLGLTANFAVGTASAAPPPAPIPVAVATPAPAPAPIPVPVVSPASPSSSTSKPSSAGGTVRAVLSGSRVTLTLNGKPVTKLAAGTYKLVAVDGSKTLGLSLLQTGGDEQPLTLTTFTGSKTSTVDLYAGTWKVALVGGKGGLGFTVK